MVDLRFNHLEALHWLWAVAALAALVAFGLWRKQRRLTRLASPALFGRLLPRASRGRQYTRAAVGVAALPCLVAGLIDPRWGVTYESVPQRGIDVIVVLDVSRSMLAEDVAPNRLGRAKQYAADLVDQLGGDRVGLVTFAGQPAVACPLTVDHAAFLLTLDIAGVRGAARGGSLLGDALRLAADSFTDDLEDHKAIVVFTDGEDQGSFPEEAARRIREERSIPVYTVGIGDAAQGARIPVEVDGQRVHLVYDGQEVWSKMNAVLLRDLALATGGAFVPVGTDTVDMGQVYRERIEPSTKRDFDATRRKRRHPRYQWFAGLALLLLTAESLMSDRAARRDREGGNGRSMT